MHKVNLTFYNNVIYFLIGFTSIIAQVIYIREFLIAFHGNELTIGLFLAFWLIWIALGSILYKNFFIQVSDYYKLIAIFLIIIAMILPLTVYFIRVLRTLFITLPGESPGCLPVMVTSALIISPICLLSGGFFALASKSYSKDSALATSTVYKYEAIGSAIGGAILSFFLLGNLNSFQLMLFLSFLNVSLAFTLFWYQISKAVKIILIFLCVGFVTVSGNLGTELHLQTTLMFWKDFTFVESKDSVYGHISVIDVGGEKSIYSNNNKIMSSGDIESAEELVHYVLLQHINPQNILVIGSTHPSAFIEIMKYKSLKKIDYVALDPVITELSKKYFSKTWQQIKRDNRLKLVNIDGRAFTNKTKNKYDVIILNAGDPVNANINRFYTFEFFEKIKNILSGNGIFTFQLSSAENYINDELAQFLRVMQKTLKTAFKNVGTIPGETIHYFAAKENNILNLKPDFIVSQLKNREINNKYINENYLYFKLLPERRQELEILIEPNPATNINEDFHPIAFFLNLVFWSSQFSSKITGSFKILYNISFKDFILIVVFLMLLIFTIYLFKRKQAKIQYSLKLVVLFLGIILITSELLVVLGFQSIYGYVYNQIAVLIGVFMAGIAFGSNIFLRQKEETKMKYWYSLVFFQIVLAFIPITILLVINIESYFLIFTMTFITGSVGGYIFPLVSKLYFSGSQNIGIIYGLDILGGMIGTLIMGLFCIPLFGFINAAMILLVINLFVALMVFIITKEIS